MVGGSVVQFDGLERGNTDEDDDTDNTLAPFQIAYAVSIHKAQGLECDSVKVVITDANEERISHAIFYTAITRTRGQLGIFWTPGTQQRILSRLATRENAKDEHLLKADEACSPSEHDQSAGKYDSSRRSRLDCFSVRSAAFSASSRTTFSALVSGRPAGVRGLVIVAVVEPVPNGCGSSGVTPPASVLGPCSG